LQRWLNRSVLSNLHVHAAAHAYRPGVGLAMHARKHQNGAYLLRLDLARFFPSIDRSDLERYIADNAHSFAGWSDQDREFFMRAVLRFGRLTIGAPTSPALSNAICAELDVRLTAYCSPLAISYTRYADDLYFSCALAGALRSVEAAVLRLLRDLPYPRNLRINHNKTRHSSRANRRVVTGVLLTPEGELSVGRAKKRSLRTLIFLAKVLPEKERLAAAGLLGSVQAIEPSFVQRLRAKYSDKVDQFLRSK